MKHESSPNFPANDAKIIGQPEETGGVPKEVPLIDRLFPPLEPDDKRRLFMESASSGSGFRNEGPNGYFETDVYVDSLE